MTDREVGRHGFRSGSPKPRSLIHGYRHKHPDGVVLVYDSGIGLYAVSGHAGVYFYEGSYYRANHDGWESTKHFQGNWKKTSSKSLPPGLQTKQAARNAKGKNE
jgi:hypothetical protein